MGEKIEIEKSEPTGNNEELSIENKVALEENPDVKKK